MTEVVIVGEGYLLGAQPVAYREWDGIGRANEYRLADGVYLWERAGREPVQVRVTGGRAESDEPGLVWYVMGGAQWARVRGNHS